MVTQVGLLYVLCTLQYTAQLLQPWHENVIHFNCLILVGLLVGFLLLCQDRLEDDVRHVQGKGRTEPPRALVAQKAAAAAAAAKTTT